MGMSESNETLWHFGFRVGGNYYGALEGGGLEGQSNLGFNFGLVILNN